MPHNFKIGQTLIWIERGPIQGHRFKVLDIRTTPVYHLVLGDPETGREVGTASGTAGIDPFRVIPTCDDIVVAPGQPIGEKATPRRKPRLTRDQKAALERYNFCLREEDRLGSSAFANPLNMRAKEAATQAAYAECLRLEMTHEHGL
jgi:hypothetical protein